MLPYLRKRPLVLTRFPDGIDGKSFYQKDAPEFAPAWIRTQPIWSDDTQRDIHYFVCDDEDSLLYIANLGSIPLHIWASRVGALEQCDWCVIDLDPKEAPFSDVVRCAQVLHALCESIAAAQLREDAPARPGCTSSSRSDSSSHTRNREHWASSWRASCSRTLARSRQ